MQLKIVSLDKETIDLRENVQALRSLGFRSLLYPDKERQWDALQDMIIDTMKEVYVYHNWPKGR